MITTLLLLSLPLQAGEQRVPAIVNGVTTDEPEAVVALTVEYDGVLYGPFCSATLIDAGWALTAAHCVEAIETAYAQQDIYVVTGGDLLTGGVDRSILVTETIANPDYDNTTYTDDIGLLRLEAPGLLGIPTIPLNDGIDGTWVGRELRFVGYGITADNASDQGTKRYADIPIVTYDLEVIYAWDPDDGQNVCQGDSGGAGLAMLGGDSYELVGVSAFVGLWKDQEGDRPCVDGFVGATRVDTHLDWILAQTGGDVTIDTGGGSNETPWGGKDTGGWCAAAPVGARGAGLLLFALGTALSRRRGRARSG